MSEPTIAYVALGSNLGDRRATIDSAVRAIEGLPETALIVVSPVIETEAVGPPGQRPYLNASLAIRTTLAPRELLEHLLSIEQEHGRTRTAESRWAPRTLDLDLLLYGQRIIDEPGLRVPHPRMHERLFVLEHLATIAGDVVHPVLGRSIGSLLEELRAADATAGRIPT